ncbi:hypothetical protein EW145_g596 [Phellinidium pouzarii]|uniref:Cytochrome P450 n=1 Tax=Phellinidium pouzarii TaxID=167371 RepID=A0A4S4LIC3_9AGAM|nr:hypothetical protein EW145_g596 [Phellinidium pouzarii]
MASRLLEMPLAAKVALLALVISATIFIKERKKGASELPLPPGPPGHWLFGNEFPRSYAQRTYVKWAREYGPVFSLKRGNTLSVFICGQQAAIDIMEKENASLADRPRIISAGEIMSGGKRMLMVGSGERFKKMRKALNSQMHIKVVEDYAPVQTCAAKNMLLDILDQPDLHLIHTKRYAASVILTLTYGKTTPTSYSDLEVQEINKCLARLSKAMLPGAFLVDTYPILRHVPGYTSSLIQSHKEELALFRSMFDAVREKLQKNEAQPCFAKYLIEKQAEYELADDELAYLAGSMFGAGVDTSATAISVVIMAAACFPDAQRKVQEQLDIIVGHDRMPSFDDMEALTEVTAFYLETFRWRPITVGGFAHRATKDIIYGPYRIPEGASVYGSHWAIGRDPDVYTDPENFTPSRWLTKQGEINNELKHFSFGFGRRVCPGQHVANRSVYISSACLLWAFNISQDPSSPIDPLAFTDTANAHPLPFRAKFEPRLQNLKEFMLPIRPASVILAHFIKWRARQMSSVFSDYPFSKVASLSSPPVPATEGLRKGKGIMAHLQKALIAPEKRYMVEVLFSRRHPKRLLPGSVIEAHSKQAPYKFTGVLLGVRRRGIDTSFTLRNIVQRMGVEMQIFVNSPDLTKVAVVQTAGGIGSKDECHLRRSKTLIGLYGREDCTGLASLCISSIKCLPKLQSIMLFILLPSCKTIEDIPLQLHSFVGIPSSEPVYKSRAKSETNNNWPRNPNALVLRLQYSRSLQGLLC